MGKRIFNLINDKRFRTILIVLFVILLIFGFYKLSSFLVSKSVSSSKVIEDVDAKKYKNKQESPDIESEEDEYKVYVDPDAEYSKVTKLFSTENLEERQKTFLGNNYDAYKTALKDVEENYESIFESIPSIPEDINYSGYIDYLRSDIDIFDSSFSSSGDIVYLRDVLTIVGLYGTHCIVYALNYGLSSDIRLLVVDYTDAKLSTDYNSLYGFGQTKSVMLFSKYSKLISRDWYKILYLKEI